jgi:hypothetical protein
LTKNLTELAETCKTLVELVKTFTELVNAKIKISGGLILFVWDFEAYLHVQGPTLHSQNKFWRNIRYLLELGAVV